MKFCHILLFFKITLQVIFIFIPAAFILKCPFHKVYFNFKMVSGHFEIKRCGKSFQIKHNL